jgi:hypothetical protein
MNSQFRSLEASKVVLNGITFEGWSQDEDALTLPDAFERYAKQTGADGLKVYGTTGEKGGEVTIKLLANSPTVQILQGFVLAEKNGAFIEWNGIVKYNDNSIATLAKGVMTKMPLGLTLGKGAPKTMTYVFEFQNIDYETISGAF